MGSLAATSRRVSVLFSFTGFNVLLLALCAATALLFLVQAAGYLPVRGDNSYPEAAAALSAQRWAQGLPLYENYRQPPYLVTAFPPLWYALLSVPARLGYANLDSVTLFGRLLNLAALFGVAGLGFVWGRQMGRPVLIALLTPALYLSFPILIPWAVTVRPDFPSLFFALLALCLAGYRPSMPWVILAGLAASLAFLIRHNAVAVPVAVVLWMVWTGRWKHAVTFCLTWGVVVAATLYVFNSSSHGMLLVNLSGAKFGRLAVTYSRDSLLRLLVSPGHGYALVLFILGALGFLYSWRDTDLRNRMVGIYAVVSLGLALFGSAAAGGDVNHYLEPALAMALLAPTGLARLRASWPEDSPLAAFAAICMVVLLLPSIDVQRWKAMHERPEDLRGFLPLVTERSVLTDVPFLAARMQSPQATDLASLSYAVRSGGWSSAGLVNLVMQKKYESVILSEAVNTAYDPAALYPRYPHLDPALRKAVMENYGLCFELGRYFVYGPNRSDGTAANLKCPALVEGVAQR
ncbi:MAG: hypothetical protein QM757_28435 [Paludibaculum sp.]